MAGWGDCTLLLFIFTVSVLARVPRDFHGSENPRAFPPSLRDPALQVFLDLFCSFIVGFGHRN